MHIPTLLLSLLTSTVLATPTPSPAQAQVEKRATTLCGSFGSIPTAGYTVYHNNWGASSASSGSQCTTFSSVSPAGSFVWSTAWSWAGGQGQVKSYSNVALEKVNRKLSAITSIKSAWSWRYTGTNMVADVSYDLWLAPSVGAANTYEIMIWLGSYGGAGPISSTGSTPLATPTIAGTKWKLFKGPNGSVTVFSFIAPANIGDFSGDLKAFFDYLTSSQGVSTGNVVTSLQAGTEPFSGSNAVFSTTAYTIKVV